MEINIRLFIVRAAPALVAAANGLQDILDDTDQERRAGGEHAGGGAETGGEDGQKGLAIGAGDGGVGELAFQIHHADLYGNVENQEQDAVETTQQVYEVVPNKRIGWRKVEEPHEVKRADGAEEAAGLAYDHGKQQGAG